MTSFAQSSQSVGRMRLHFVILNACKADNHRWNEPDTNHFSLAFVASQRLHKLTHKHVILLKMAIFMYTHYLITLMHHMNVKLPPQMKFLIRNVSFHVITQ